MRIRLRTSNPIACRNVIAGTPKSSGSSAFHSSITAAPTSTTAITANSANFNPYHNQRLLIVFSSAFTELVMNGLQPAPQVQNRISLARQQGVHRHAGRRREFPEAAPFEFARDENTALLFSQFIQR